MSQTNNLCEREQLFQSLLTQAKKKGFLTMETVTKQYAKYHLTEEQLEDLYNEFEDKDVYLSIIEHHLGDLGEMKLSQVTNADIKMTLNRYSHLLPQHMRASMAKMEEHYY